MNSSKITSISHIFGPKWFTDLQVAGPRTFMTGTGKREVKVERRCGHTLPPSSGLLFERLIMTAAWPRHPILLSGTTLPTGSTSTVPGTRYQYIPVGPNHARAQSPDTTSVHLSHNFFRCSRRRYRYVRYFYGMVPVR
jgi:hypothetical protein